MIEDGSQHLKKALEKIDQCDVAGSIDALQAYSDMLSAYIEKFDQLKKLVAQELKKNSPPSDSATQS